MKMLSTETIFYFLFVFSSIILIRFILSFISSLLQKEPKPLIRSNGDFISLVLTISYILTYLRFS